jgi:phosphoribosylformylglycinamidine cyclo-ligase
MTDERVSLKYSDSGVNIDAANVALGTIKELVKRTYTEHVLCDIGTFGAMFQLDVKQYADPVLVSSVDGVGTKLKLAFMTGKHDTVGVDLVSHCVNDILVQGAKPLFFLDYFAVGKLEPEVVVEVVRGFPQAVAMPVAPLSAAKLPRCPTCTSPANMISLALSSGLWTVPKLLTVPPYARAM